MYDVIVAGSVKELLEKESAAEKAGQKPQGGVSVILDDYYGPHFKTFYQAMVSDEIDISCKKLIEVLKDFIKWKHGENPGSIKELIKRLELK